MGHRVRGGRSRQSPTPEVKQFGEHSDSCLLIAQFTHPRFIPTSVKPGWQVTVHQPQTVTLRNTEGFRQEDLVLSYLAPGLDRFTPLLAHLYRVRREPLFPMGKPKPNVL